MKKDNNKMKKFERNEEYYDEEELLMTKVGGRFSQLPLDLFYDVLSRLPLKSVSQSKTWFSLIHRPLFAELHYSREVHHSTSATPKEIEFKGFDDIFSSQGDHTVLPKSPKFETAPAISGFGFDPHTKHYKVIRILQHEKDVAKPTEAEIFTLGSNTWRKIKNIPYITHKGVHNVLVNGNLHWISHRNLKDFQHLVIVSFNVGSEEINLIEPPPCPTRRHLSTTESLRAFDGSLCVINAYYNSYLAGPDTEMSQIWVMTDYGVQGSWVKVKNRVLIKLQNDEILVKLRLENVEFGYYNLTDNSFRPIKIHQMCAMHFAIPPMILFGSLFSPKNANELKKR